MGWCLRPVSSLCNAYGIQDSNARGLGVGGVVRGESKAKAGDGNGNGSD